MIRFGGRNSIIAGSVLKAFCCQQFAACFGIDLILRTRQQRWQDEPQQNALSLPNPGPLFVFSGTFVRSLPRGA